MCNAENIFLLRQRFRALPKPYRSRFPDQRRYADFKPKRIYEHTVCYQKSIRDNLPTFKCISRLQSRSLKQTLPFLNLCWNEEIWTLWSSYGSWWERVSQFLFFRLSAVYLFELFQLKCHCRCDVLPRHRGLPEIGHWRIEIWSCQTLGMKRYLGICFIPLLMALLSAWFGSICSRFTETAAVLSANSSCSPTTSRSIMCPSQESPLCTCC